MQCLLAYETNPLNINILRDMVEEFFDFDLLRSTKDLKLFLCATHGTGKLKLFTLIHSHPTKCWLRYLPFLLHAVKWMAKTIGTGAL